MLIGLVFTTSIVIFAISLRIAERYVSAYLRNLNVEYPKYFQGKSYPGDLEKF